MELTYTPFRIKCLYPFGIARSTHSYYDVVYIYLEQDGIIGRGEAAPPTRYNESTGKVLSQLEQSIQLPEQVISLEEVINILDNATGGLRALKAAFSMSLLDWWTQKRGLPLYKYFKTDREFTPITSFTIAIGDRELIPQKIAEAEPYHILKVKLGTPDDKEIVQIVRGETDKLLRVDANEGWDLDTAIEMCNWLADYNIEFIEQPVKAGQIAAMEVLKKKSPLPLIADEDCCNAADIPEIAAAFHGINIKLMKCGSLEEAKRMIDLAREYELKIMLGCMVESSVGVTAAAHLSPLVDYADLDGNLLIGNDPYQGVQIDDGRLVLPDSPGLGLSLNTNAKNKCPELK